MDKPLVILFITYKRTQYALRTIDSVFKNLVTKRPLSWYICDDDSPTDHYTAVMDRIRAHGGQVCGHHSQKLGYGAGCNKGWKIASQTGPVTLWLEDDWELEIKWNIDPYVDLLIDNDNVGMIRMGHLPIGQSGRIVSEAKTLYIDTDLNNPYCYSGNPHLKHDRFMLHYGPLPVGYHPGETETRYDGRVHEKGHSGPRIYWPLFIGDRYLWGHIGTEPSYNRGGSQ